MQNHDLIEKCADLHGRARRYPVPFYRNPELRGILERRTAMVLHLATSPRGGSLGEVLKDLHDVADSILDPSQPGHGEFRRLVGEVRQLANRP